MEVETTARPVKLLIYGIETLMQPRALVSSTLASIGLGVGAVAKEQDVLFYLALLLFPGSIFIILFFPLVLCFYVKGLLSSEDTDKQAILFAMSAPIVVIACLMTTFRDTVLLLNIVESAGEAGSHVLFAALVGSIFLFVCTFDSDKPVGGAFKKYLPLMVKAYLVFIVISLFEGWFPYKQTSYRLGDVGVYDCITKGYKAKGGHKSYVRTCTVSFEYKEKVTERRLRVVDLAEEFVIRHGVFNHYYTR